MKRFLIFILFATIKISASAQCSITKTKTDDGIAYISNAESIYRNPDLENGILGAYIQLVIIQKKDNKDLMIGAFIIKVVNKRPKAPLIPRKVTLILDDKTLLEFSATNLTTTTPTAGITQNQCDYSLSLANYKKLLANKIERIIIEDTRLKEQISFSPFDGLIQEQANCIVSKLDSNSFFLKSE